MIDWGHIAIATRLGHIDPAFFWSWTGLIMNGRRPFDVVLDPSVNVPHVCACNLLAWRFFQTKCDTLLFIDDDMEFSHDALERLRESGMQYDVLSALFCCGRHPHRPCVLNGYKNGRPAAARAETIKGIMPVDYVGFGFTMIRRWVLEEMRKKTGDAVFEFHSAKGEDGWFSEQARELRAKLAVNTDVAVGHRVDKTVYFDKKERAIVIGDNSFGLDVE